MEISDKYEFGFFEGFFVVTGIFHIAKKVEICYLVDYGYGKKQWSSSVVDFNRIKDHKKIGSFDISKIDVKTTNVKYL